jgi:nucleoside-diphosphate-sugar epimerase
VSERVLVTGAAGFVGKHLVTALLDDGCDIVATDIEAPPDKYADQVGGRIDYRRGDLTDPEFRAGLSLTDYDRIYHLAAIVGVSDYVENPLRIVETNVEATKAILERIRGSNVRFVFLSTSEIYGKNPDVPWPETADRVHGPPTVDRWNYSTGKAACEHMIHGLAAEDSPFSATVIRPFNLYGPGQRPNFVIPAFVDEVVNGNAPVVYDEGTQTRCFTYIDDFVEGVRLASTRPEGENEVFNLGSTRETRIRDLAEMVVDIADADVEPEFVDTDELYGDSYEDLERRVPDVSKAARELGWETTTSLETGVERVIEWGRDHYRDD